MHLVATNLVQSCTSPICMHTSLADIVQTRTMYLALRSATLTPLPTPITTHASAVPRLHKRAPSNFPPLPFFRKPTFLQAVRHPRVSVPPPDTLSNRLHSRAFFSMRHTRIKILSARPSPPAVAWALRPRTTNAAKLKSLAIPILVHQQSRERPRPSNHTSRERPT